MRCSRRCRLLDDDAATTLILNGDVPLIRADHRPALVDACAGERLALLTIELADPTGYGRIVRGDAGYGGVRARIVEHKDATRAAAQHPRDLHRHAWPRPPRRSSAGWRR